MKEEISIEEIVSGGEYVIVDVRDEAAFEYGHIDGAVNIPAERVCQSDLPKDKPLYICCRNGVVSAEVAENLRAMGYIAFNLKGGYREWLKAHLLDGQPEDVAKRVEDSIKKKYHKKLFSRFEIGRASCRERV